MTKPFATLKVGSDRVNVQFTGILCIIALVTFSIAFKIMYTAALNATDLTNQYILADGMLICGAVVIASLILLCTDEFGFSISKEE